MERVESNPRDSAHFPSTAAILQPALNCGVFFKDCNYSVDHTSLEHSCPPDTCLDPCARPTPSHQTCLTNGDEKIDNDC